MTNMCARSVAVIACGGLFRDSRRCGSCIRRVRPDARSHYFRELVTSVGGHGGATCAKADALRESRAQVRVHLTPEVDGALQDKWLDTAHGPDEVADQVVAVGLRHDIAIQHAGLDEVII